MVWRGLVHSRGFAALAEALERHVSPVARAVLQAPFVFGDTTEQLRTPRLSAPLRMASAAECIRFERESFGAFNQLMAHLPPEKREAIWDEAGSGDASVRRPTGLPGAMRTPSGSRRDVRFLPGKGKTAPTRHGFAERTMRTISPALANLGHPRRFLPQHYKEMDAVRTGLHQPPKWCY